MSQKKRKLGYWGIEFVNGDETYFDSSLFENFIEYVKGLDSVQLLQRDPQNSKAISLDKIWTTSSQGRRLYEVRFKSCKYNHSPDYMSSRDGTERPTEKQLYEGDKELTHLCLRIDTDEAFCVIEERKSGVTLGAVVRYFNLLLRDYLLSQGSIALDALAELLPTAVSILIGFTVMLITLLLTTDSDQISKLKTEITENRVRGKKITLYQKLHIQLTESLFSEVFLLLTVFAYLFYSGITSVLLTEIAFLLVEVYLTAHILLGIIRSITHLYCVFYSPQI